jgi:hypothetical protein
MLLVSFSGVYVQKIISDSLANVQQTVEKQVKNGDSTLVAGGKQVYILMSGVYPKDARTNLDIVTNGEIKGKLGIGSMTTACGASTVRAQ